MYVIVCYCCNKTKPQIVKIVEKSKLSIWLDVLNCVPYDNYYNDNTIHPNCRFELSNQIEFYYSKSKMFTKCKSCTFDKYAIIDQQNNNASEILNGICIEN